MIPHGVAAVANIVGAVGIISIGVTEVAARVTDRPEEKPAYDYDGDDEIVGIDVDRMDVNVYFDDFTDPETDITHRCLVVAIGHEVTGFTTSEVDVECPARQR